MISLNLSTGTNITLNNYILNSINLFKYTPSELHKYVIDKCNNNPLVYIKDDHQLSAQPAGNDCNDIMEEISLHFSAVLSPEERKTMDVIFGSLSPKGFLEVSSSDIAAITNDSVSKVEHLIELLKAYECKGIGSGDAMDYISFQLITEDKYDEEYFTAFKNHLNEIHNNDFKFLTELSINPESFIEYVEEYIKTCRLYPLDGDEVIDLIPEGFIRLSNGKFQIQIDDYLADDIVFEPLCLTEGETDFSKKIKAYRDEFTELASMLKTRKIYMLKILNVICDVQKDYLAGRKDYLMTLDQTMLSELTELSPATVSRLISNKYISTPRGMLPIQSLLSKEFCKGHSVSQVKFVIKNITDYERLSDNKISLLLGELGIRISRRTVNKYKNQILQSS